MPGAQREQALAPASAKEPAEHSVFSPSVQKKPSGHIDPVTLDDPAAQNMPGVNPMQALQVNAFVAPMMSEYLPTAHSVHFSAPFLSE